MNSKPKLITTALLLAVNGLSLGVANAADLTVYQNGMALIQSQQDLKLKEGVQTIQFENISSMIKPDSVLLSGKGVDVIEQNFTNDLMSLNKMLEASVGHKIQLFMDNKVAGDGMENAPYNVQDAKLIALRDGFILVEVDVNTNKKKDPKDLFSGNLKTNRVMALPVSQYADRIAFNDIPDNLSATPTLSITLQSDKTESKSVSLSYLSGGFGWDATYTADIVDDEHQNWNAWATIKNQTPQTYEDLTLHLIAGQPNFVTQSNSRAGRSTMEMAVLADGAQAQESSISDFKVYDLPYNVELKSNQSKQLALFSKPMVEIKKTYKTTYPIYLNRVIKEQAASIEATVTNTEQAGLGLTMPAGIVRFYESDANGLKQMVGESRLPDLDVNQSYTMGIGKAFGLSVSNEPMPETDTTPASGKITIKNSTSKSKTVGIQIAPVSILEQDARSERVRSIPKPVCETDDFGRLKLVDNFKFGKGVDQNDISSEGSHVCVIFVDIDPGIIMEIPYQYSRHATKPEAAASKDNTPTE